MFKKFEAFCDLETKYTFFAYDYYNVDLTADEQDFVDAVDYQLNRSKQNTLSILRRIFKTSKGYFIHKLTATIHKEV